jgi:threonyl-tRNA synthetase
VFCTPDQVAAEARAALELIQRAHRDLGIKPVRYRLSLRGDGGKYVDNPELWQRSEAMLRDVLSDLDHVEQAPGEAAFYGPKIDIQIADSAERESSISTVQVDLHQPSQFDLSYIGPDGARHRPVMVHHSLIGSMERCVAHLIEVYGGAFPAWFAPVQLAILPISDDELPAALVLEQRCLDLGLRAEVVGVERGSLGARIRESRLVPYQAIVGAKEVANEEVALRLRDGRKLDPLPVDEALGRIGAMVGARSLELW